MSSNGTDLGGRRRRMASAPKSGSVWETRIKLDDVNGGIKVFSVNSPPQTPPKHTPILASASPSPNKRKTWKSEISGGSPVQIARHRSADSSKILDEKLKESGVVQVKETVSHEDFKSSVSLQLVKVTGNNAPHVEKKVIDEPKLKIGGSEEECEVKEITSNFSISDQILQTPSKEDGEIGKETKVVEIQNKNLEIKEIDFQESGAKKFVIEEKKPIRRNQKSSPLVKNKPISDNFPEIPRTENRLQSLVDLIMWRDVSKSALVFGIGAFLIISSSYTKDLNTSFISVISYMGLVYLAAIFLFRSFIPRCNGNDERNIMGEEEAIWLVKALLPFVNEFLLKLRALFSGDPATTMKLAVVLFILARYGSSITLLNLAKLGFVGIFTVPKVCSSYSLQLASYGTLWKQRLMDAWDSCSHKKALGFAIFALLWNLSSLVARIWAVFMLFVAFKHYQHSMIQDGWVRS